MKSIDKILFFIIFNNIEKAFLYCRTEGRTHTCEESLMIQTLNKDQTFCPITQSLEWKRWRKLAGYCIL